MTNIISISKSAGVLLVVISAFFSTYTHADSDFDDNPEPGCDSYVSINDFL